MAPIPRLWNNKQQGGGGRSQAAPSPYGADGIDLTAERPEDKKLKEACQEFEGMFLTQLVTAMRSTTFKSALFGNSQEEEMYQSMLNEQLAQMMAHQDGGGMGLADLMYQQITGHP